MSIKFTNFTDYAILPQTLTSQNACTVSGWFRATSTTAMYVFSQADSLTDLNESTFARLHNGVVYAQQTDNGFASHADSSAFPTTDTWFHAAWVYAAAASRYAWLNGTKGTQETTSRTPLPNPATYYTIGDWKRGSGTNGGLLLPTAELAIWDAVLTDPEIVALSQGISPRRIRLGKLKHYMPCRGEFRDIMRPITTLSATVVVQADHPRIYY